MVVIDPGHSKKSSGTYKTWDGITYHEEDLTMKIAVYESGIGKVWKYYGLFDEG